MHKELLGLGQLEPSRYAMWLAELAKKCFSGLGDVKPSDITRLSNNKTLTGLKRPTVIKTVSIIESVRLQPTPANLSESMYLLAKTGEGFCYSHEAWFDIANALGRAAVDETRTPNDHLAVIRNRLRYSGRRTREKMLSRTVLVKGPRIQSRHRRKCRYNRQPQALICRHDEAV
jgi:hypothetical protein